MEAEYTTQVTKLQKLVDSSVDPLQFVASSGAGPPTCTVALCSVYNTQAHCVYIIILHAVHVYIMCV